MVNKFGLPGKSFDLFHSNIAIPNTDFVYSNEADIRMIEEMGVPCPQISHTRSPGRKLGTAISLVRSMVRMQRRSREWKKTRKLGEGLKRAKSEVLKRKESLNKKATK